MSKAPDDTATTVEPVVDRRGRELPEHLEPIDNHEYDGRCRECEFRIKVGKIEHIHSTSCEHHDEPAIDADCWIPSGDRSKLPDHLVACECPEYDGICWECGEHVRLGVQEWDHDSDCSHYEQRPNNRGCVIKGGHPDELPTHVLEMNEDEYAHIAACECDNHHGVCWECGQHLTVGSHQYGHEKDGDNTCSKRPDEGVDPQAESGRGGDDA